MCEASLSLSSHPERPSQLHPTLPTFHLSHSLTLSPFSHRKFSRLSSLLLPFSLSPLGSPFPRFNPTSSVGNSTDWYPSQSLYKPSAHTVPSIFCVSSDGVRGSPPSKRLVAGSRVPGWCARTWHEIDPCSICKPREKTVQRNTKSHFSFSCVAFRGEDEN